MLVYGNKVSGILRPLNDVTAGVADRMSKPGEVYEIQFDCDRPFSPEDEQFAIAQVLTLESKVPDLRVVYVETCNHGKVTLQVMDAGPGFISLPGLLSSIPALMMLGAIIVVAYMLYAVVQPTTLNQWALIFGGAAVVGLGIWLAIGSVGVGQPTAIWTGRSGNTTRQDKKFKALNAERITASKVLASVDSRIGEYKEQAKDKNESIAALGKPTKKWKPDQIQAYNKEKQLLETELTELDTKLRQAKIDKQASEKRIEQIGIEQGEVYRQRY